MINSRHDAGGALVTGASFAFFLLFDEDRAHAGRYVAIVAPMYLVQPIRSATLDRRDGAPDVDSPGPSLR